MVSDGREYQRMRDHATTVETQSGKHEQRKQLYEEIRCNLSKAYEGHKKTYDLRSNPGCPSYSVGEKVLKRNFELSDKAKGFCFKLAPKYELAVVRKILGKHCYELEDQNGKRLGVFYGNHLKKMHQT